MRTRPYIVGFGDPKSPLIASVLGPALVITARVRRLGLGLLRPYIARLLGSPNPSDIGPGSPNRGGGGHQPYRADTTTPS